MTAMPQDLGSQLAGYSLAPQLKLAAVEQRTGLFSVRTGSTLRNITILHGRIVFAGSNDREERLNSILLRRGLVSLEDLTGAVSLMLKENRRLGEVLVEQGSLDRQAVTRALRVQMTEIICRLLSLRSAELSFRAQAVPDHADVGYHTPLNALIRASFFQVRDVHHVMDEIGGPSAVVAPTAAFSAETATCGLTPEQQNVVSMLTEPHEIVQICRVSDAADFDICRLVWVLLTVGALYRLA